MRRRGELYAALAAIGFGSAYVATALALRSFDPLPVAIYRGLLAAIAVAVMLAVSRRRSVPRPAAEPPARPSRLVRAIHVALIAAFGGPIFIAAMNLAVASVGATIASFVAGLYAILAALFAPVLLREPLRATALAGFLAALVGTALLAELDPAAPTIGGIGWGLVAAVSFALFLVLARRWSVPDRLDPIVLVLVSTTATTVGLGAIVLVTNPGSFQPRAIAFEAVLGVAWLAFVTAAGQALAIRAVRLLSASRSSAFLLLNPIAAAILSLALLGEQPTALQGLGGLLVLAGIAVVTIRRSGKPGS
ncbi:MAG TPA: DMT family transporter [Candidatus Limnocylindrales bacterium]|nr:DMT family transporter [Candidatus Limnocylindrales bacterium]